MLGAKEKIMVLPLVLPSRTLNKSGQGFVVMVVTLFTLLLLGSDAVLAQGASSIEELKRQIGGKEKAISSINSNISAYKQSLKVKEEELLAKKTSYSVTLKNSEDVIKKYNRRILKLERDANILQEQVSELKEKNKKQIEKFENLNILSKSMERSDHNEVLKNNESKIAIIQLDLDKINKALTTTNSTLNKSKFVFESQKRISDIYSEENNPEILKLNRLINNALTLLAKEKKAKEAYVVGLNKLEIDNASKKPKFIEPPKAIKPNTQKKEVKKSIVQGPKPKLKKPVNVAIAKSNEKPKPWVYLISGKKTIGLGYELGLRDWIRSYDANYIEADWGSYSGGKEDFKSGFIKRFEADLKSIPEDSKLVLIGHGLGGGAAILAATTVAYRKGRVVDLLAVLDPVGENKLRANIVFQSPEPCSLQNNNFGRVVYFACLDTARPRIITPNVKAFYNRWQKDGGFAVDNQRQYSISDGQGNIFTLSSATGKFQVNNETEANQKRYSKNEWQGNSKNLIADASKELTNILVPYLQ